MKYRVTIADLGWYEVNSESQEEAEENALFAARNFHPEREKFEIEKTEAQDDEN